ncbi:MAG: hypothetical protein WB771_13230 [Solirubrobacterales bacterium]
MKRCLALPALVLLLPVAGATAARADASRAWRFLARLHRLKRASGAATTSRRSTPTPRA